MANRAAHKRALVALERALSQQRDNLLLVVAERTLDGFWGLANLVLADKHVAVVLAAVRLTDERKQLWVGRVEAGEADACEVQVLQDLPALC